MVEIVKIGIEQHDVWVRFHNCPIGDIEDKVLLALHLTTLRLENYCECDHESPIYFSDWVDCIYDGKDFYQLVGEFLSKA